MGMRLYNRRWTATHNRWSVGRFTVLAGTVVHALEDPAVIVMSREKVEVVWMRALKVGKPSISEMGNGNGKDIES